MLPAPEPAPIPPLPRARRQFAGAGDPAFTLLPEILRGRVPATHWGINE